MRNCTARIDRLHSANEPCGWNEGSSRHHFEISIRETIDQLRELISASALTNRYCHMQSTVLRKRCRLHYQQCRPRAEDLCQNFQLRKGFQISSVIVRRIIILVGDYLLSLRSVAGRTRQEVARFGLPTCFKSSVVTNKYHAGIDLATTDSTVFEEWMRYR